MTMMFDLEIIQQKGYIGDLMYSTVFRSLYETFPFFDNPWIQIQPTS